MQSAKVQPAITERMGEHSATAMPSMTTITLAVDGMSCEGCENSIQSALGALDGVSAVDASHEAKTVKVDYDAGATDEAALKDVIEDIGFEPI